MKVFQRLHLINLNKIFNSLQIYGPAENILVRMIFIQIFNNINISWKLTA